MKVTHGPLGSIATGGRVAWWLLLIVGVWWIIVGFLVLQLNGTSATIVLALASVILLLAAAGEVFRTIVTVSGWRFWHIAFAILLVVAAIVNFSFPGVALVSLALTFSFYFVFAGTFDVISSLFMTATPGWWVQLLSGLLQLVLGILASSSVRDSVVLLLTYVAASAVFRGVAEISAAFATRAIVTA